MNRKIRDQLIEVLFVVVIAVMCMNAFAGEEKKLDSLLVQGEGFIFGVKEPPGWKADTSNAVNARANILFYKPGDSLQTAKALIFVRVNKKSDEYVEKDLEWDMDQYKKQYPNVQFKDIQVFHPKYKTYSKLFYIKETFYEYVTYINPGAGKPVTLSAAMNLQRNEASKEELDAYQKVIETLVLLKP